MKIKKTNKSENSAENEFLTEDKDLEGLSIAELRERIKSLEEIMRAEIERRDSIIEDLKKKNEVLLKTALKQSMKNEELKSLFEQIKSKKNDDKKKNE
ncbi:MAG: hypothetical protein ACP5OZ_02135 [Candidatus Woesearchaeota archaeon]